MIVKRVRRWHTGAWRGTRSTYIESTGREGVRVIESTGLNQRDGQAGAIITLVRRAISHESSGRNC